MNKADLIKNNYLFRGLTAGDLSALAKITEEKDLMAGNLIYDTGQDADASLRRRRSNHPLSGGNQHAWLCPSLCAGFVLALPRRVSPRTLLYSRSSIGSMPMKSTISLSHKFVSGSLL
jgi:hypothetical protein